MAEIHIEEFWQKASRRKVNTFHIYTLSEAGLFLDWNGFIKINETGRHGRPHTHFKSQRLGTSLL